MKVDIVTGADWCVPTAFAAALDIDNTKEVADLIREISDKGRQKGYLEDKNGNVSSLYIDGVRNLSNALGIENTLKEYAFNAYDTLRKRKRLVSQFLKSTESGVWVISVRDCQNAAHALCVDLNNNTVLDSALTKRNKHSLDDSHVKRYLSRKRLYWIVQVS